MAIFALFGLFGLACGHWLSVTGMSIATFALIAAYAAANLVLGNAVSIATLVWCLVVVQVGYVGMIAMKALGSHALRIAGGLPRDGRLRERPKPGADGP